MPIAWYAGLFEGEGWITIHKQCKHVRVGIKMTDLDILQRFHNEFGGYLTPAKKTKEHYKDVWEWRMGEANAVKSFLHACLPFFGERRAYQSANAFDRLDSVF